MITERRRKLIRFLSCINQRMLPPNYFCLFLYPFVFSLGEFYSETVREVAIRGDKMLDIIRHRNERNILVVSHGVFLETLLNRCSLACVDEGLRARRFDNAEMRSIVIGGWGSIVYPPQLINPNKGALAQLMDNNSSNSSTDASVTNNSNGNTGINGITTTASTTTTTNK